MLAYHFVGSTLRDGRPVPPDGEWLIHEGSVEICKSGLHASLTPFDALRYAPGNTICLVEVEDIVSQEKDKLVCRRRRIVRRVDGKALLRRFAADQALSVADKWDMPDVVRSYLTTLDLNLRADAAHAAARAADAAAADAAHAAARAARAAVYAAAAAVYAAAYAYAYAACAYAANANAAAAADFNERVYKLLEVDSEC